MSLWFEEFAAGQCYRSPRPRPVTQRDITAFAELSGDLNRLHVDPEFAQTTQFGGTIAHGLFGLALAGGFLHDMGIVAETVLAFATLEWKFRAPVRPGDALTMAMTVSRTRGAGPKAGLVAFAAALENQRGETVQEGAWSLMVKKRA